MTRPIDLDAELQAAAHRLCAAGGLRAVGFRSLAREAEVSVGMLGHRYGTLDGLLERLVAGEVNACEQRFAAWSARIEPGAEAAALPLADLLAEVLDDELANARPAALFQAELLVAPGLSALVRPLGQAWIDGWQSLLARRRPGAARHGALLAGLMADERAFGLAFGSQPAYRLLRKAALMHLLAGFPATEFAGLDRLFHELETLSITADRLPAAERAALLAAAIADILEQEGAGAVSHRAVAARVGVPNSTVAHHFRTTERLIEAGMAALYDRFRRPAQAPDSSSVLDRIGRSTHGMALAAARDGRYRPYAIDMRWRRGENLRRSLPFYLGAPADRPWTLTAQTLSMAMIGLSLLAGQRGATDAAIAGEALGTLEQA